MATSGSKDFDLSSNSIINLAFQEARLSVRGETLSSDRIATARQQFNMLVKFLGTKTDALWKRRRIAVFVVPGQDEYDISDAAGADRSCYLDDLVKTTVDGAQTAPISTLTVASGTGIAVNDVIGIRVSSTSMHWTTVASVSTNDIGLNDNITSDVEDGARVFVYTSKAHKPLKIMNAQVLDSSDNQTVVHPFGRKDWLDQPNRTQTGTIVNVAYTPQRTNGKLLAWPTGNDVAEYLQLDVMEVMDDMDASSDDPDLPQEWFLCLVKMLAARLAVSYGVPIQRQQYLDTRAEEIFRDMIGHDKENAPFMIEIDSGAGDEFFPQEDCIWGFD